MNTKKNFDTKKKKKKKKRRKKKKQKLEEKLIENGKTIEQMKKKTNKQINKINQYCK